ncbi:glycerol-3-phosphate dehydrogenase/oxidase [Nocardioides pacificus]
MTPLLLDRFVERLDGEALSVDVLILGGGITGAAIAHEAASRGYSVALVERDDFGAATSAATGKLVHGGLRYLKHLEVRLVRESLRERRILSEIAPNLVHPYPIVLPDAGLVEHLGLTAYDVLSLDRNRVRDPGKRIPRHRRMSAAEARAARVDSGRTPLLYHDCVMISPERLTLAFLRSAATNGALITNHTRAERLLTEPAGPGTRVLGAVVTDLLDGHEHEIRARVVVNATGPWAHDVLARDPATRETAGARPRVRSEGIYLVTRQLTDVMTLHVTPHGHFSCAPWRGHSLIGPTEKPYTGPVDDWRLTRQSLTEFLAVINASSMLPVELGLDDVVFAYGGLRPLTETQTDDGADEGADDTYNASRASEYVDHARDGVEGLITTSGGKYTTSRHFAERTLRAVQRKVGRPASRSRTARTPLHGCDTGPFADYLAASIAANPDFAPETVRYLVQHHGTEHGAVLELAREDPELARRLDADGELLAQVVVATRWEMARTLRDVMLRRTGLGTLGLPDDETLTAIASVAARELGWDADRQAAEIDDVRRALTLPS